MGDVGHVLDVMALFLENIPVTAVASRATMATIYRAASIVASIHDTSYHNKVISLPIQVFQHQLHVINQVLIGVCV